MSVENGERFYPVNPTVKSVFDLANLHNLGLGSTPERIAETPPDRLIAAAQDYTCAGIAYLANYGKTSYIQHLGDLTWWAFSNNFVKPMLTTTLKGSLKTLGFSDDEIKPFEGEPAAITAVSNYKEVSKKVIQEQHHAFIEPAFICAARENPLWTLSEMAGTASAIRDIINGRNLIDQSAVTIRADATQAHFLITSGVNLPEDLQGLVNKYPNGLNSLPPETRYRGVTLPMLLNAKYN